MQDRPTKEQLLQAVSGFFASIEAQTDALTPQQIFHARVAGNVLEIIRREIALAPEFEAAEHARLTTLLGDKKTIKNSIKNKDLYQLNKLLCEEIEAGNLSINDPKLMEHLLKTAQEKLAIDQPNYAGLNTK